MNEMSNVLNGYQTGANMTENPNCSIMNGMSNGMIMNGMENAMQSRLGSETFISGSGNNPSSDNFVSSTTGLEVSHDAHRWDVNSSIELEVMSHSSSEISVSCFFSKIQNSFCV